MLVSASLLAQMHTDACLFAKNAEDRLLHRSVDTELFEQKWLGAHEISAVPIGISKRNNRSPS